MKNQQKFTLKQIEGRCVVYACSESQGFSVVDYSTNYCNLHNLYCGDEDDCPSVLHNFDVTEDFSANKCTQNMKSKCIVPEYLPSKPVVEKKRDNFYPEGTVYVKLRNGIQMPVVASGVPGSDFVANTKIILDAKVAHIDTAYQYGNQHGIGLGLKGYNRTSYFLTTKIPECGSNDLKDTSHCGKQSTKLMEQNLQELDVEYVDLMLVHRPPHGVVVRYARLFKINGGLSKNFITLVRHEQSVFRITVRSALIA